MNARLACGVLVVLLVGLVATMVAGANAQSGDDKPNCTVIQTDGSHLIVTDSNTNTLYFYAIDQDAKVGDELKLRGTLDLNQVGKSTLKPTRVAADK